MAQGSGDRRPRRALWAWIVGAFLIGGVAGALVHEAWPIPLHALISWGYAFSTSAGLGGVAALFAAVIAYRGVTRSTETSRQSALESADTARRAALESAETARNTALEAQWWENARWAADRLLSVSEVTEEDDNADIEDGADEEDANINLLVDQDAYAAIIMLEYLGENAPSAKARSFALDALGAVLGVPSGVDNEDIESASDVADRPSNRTPSGKADL